MVVPILGNSLSTTTERPERVDTTLKTPFHHDNLDMLEYPFLTMSKYPQGFILHLGEIVDWAHRKRLAKIVFHRRHCLFKIGKAIGTSTQSRRTGNQRFVVERIAYGGSITC